MHASILADGQIPRVLIYAQSGLADPGVVGEFEGAVGIAVGVDVGASLDGWRVGWIW